MKNVNTTSATGLLFTNGAYDKNCYPLQSVEELGLLTSHEYYQRQLTAYRSGDAEAKRKLAALIPQGRLKNPTIRLHQAEHLVPSGWVFLDDDRPTEVITAEERHRLVEERLAQVGLTHMPHVAQRSASMKYHLLVKTPSNLPLYGEAAQLKDAWEWWQRFFEGILVLDPSTVNVNRLMFVTGEWLTPVDALFEAMGEVESEKMKDESSLPNGINFPLSSLNFQLETIAERLIESLCGTTTPPEGSRNNTLYEAARQMAYLDGITEDVMLDAFAPLHYLGLPQHEARQCIRSAMRHEKTWKYTLPPELSRAMEQTHPIPPCEGGGSDIAEAQVLPHRANKAEENQLNVDLCRYEGSAVHCTTGARRDLGGSHLVFKDINLTIRRGEKVAFVGKNGEGKSTLVKCIMGEIPYEGKLTIGHNVEIGYFAQNQAQLLDEELTVFDTIDRVAVGDIRLKIRDILGAFMFGGEASDKKVKVLSGGERSRLAMIKLLLEQVNLLILDEPTNHLDMRSKDVLKEAIREFDGTVIVVSHDREFLDGLVTKVYEFGGGKVREHLGGIYDYLQKKEVGETPSNSLSMGRTQTSSSSKLSDTPSIEARCEGGGSSYAARKEQAKQQRKLQKRVEECEKKVAKIEAEIKELEEWMATPTGAANQALFEQYGQLKNSLAEAEAEWEEAMMALEE